ncbi:MAG: alpha-2-macroglobulin, partial [Treponema sp.]|nr:alpha-2-macroglobulin [Treponema sp.]
IAAVGSTVVHPAAYYIGVSKPEGVTTFPKAGQQLSFNYVLALPDESLLSAQGNTQRALTTLLGSAKKMTITLTREEWSAVQQQGIGGDVYSRYERVEIQESEQTVSLAASGKFSVTAAKPGYHTVTLTAADAAGRDVITQYSFFATGSGRTSWYQEDASSIRLTPNQNQYNPGDTAHILMESVLPKGDYLITVEREGIFTEEVRHFDDGVQILEIPVAQNYVPVVYVSVASYSVRNGPPQNEYGVADLDKPKGYYGVTSLFVNPRVKAFSVKIESEKQAFRPGEDVEITLTATKGGQPLAQAELTLMAVDRGVLDLVNYHVPDPIAFFYATQNFPLRVYGGDSRAFLMDPVTYEVKNLQGGDASDDDKFNERSDFNPTAVFEPVLVTDEYGKVTCTFKLPDTLTTYRITAFGVNGELLALQESEIVVQQPVNVQQVLPRRLRERDTSEAGVLITNLDDRTHEIAVALNLVSPETIEAENGVQQRAGSAFVDGDATHSVRVAPGESTVVYFDVAAVQAGLVHAVFTIRSAAINERIVAPLVIERPYVYETFTTVGSIATNEKEAHESLVIPGFADDGKGTLAVTLDATRLGLLNEAVKYVFDYPYGCLEQQSSRVLPLLLFGDYIDVFDLNTKVVDAKQVVVSYLREWKAVQHRNGGFGYWPTSRDTDVYVSARIAHIWALAGKKGYTKSQLALNGNQLSAYLHSTLNRNDLNSYLRAYIYYVLSLMESRVSQDALRTLYNSSTDISTLAYVGLAAYEHGREYRELAQQCAQKIRQYLRPTTRGVDISYPSDDARNYYGYYNYYGTANEHLALALHLFVQIDQNDQMVTRLLYSLLKAQQAGYWTSTATTARVFEAIATVIRVTNLEMTDVAATAGINETELARGSFKGAGAKPVTAVIPFDDARLSSLKKDTAVPLQFTKTGRGALYYTAALTYAIPQEMQYARDEGLGIYLSLYDNATGEEITARANSTEVQLESGKTYRVQIRLSSSRDRTFVALRAPVPSGAEILDATFVTTADDGSNTSTNARYHRFMSNQTIFDNEVQFFWNFFARGETTAEFKFRAVRRGVFPTPPTLGECMYEPEVFGRTAGVLYTIR